MDIALQYVRQSKVTRSLLEGKVRDGRNEKIPHRHAYVLLRSHARHFFTQRQPPRMIALSGLRGVGKTTLAWQTANYVYHHFTKSIYYINVDEIVRYDLSILDVINALEEHLKRPLTALDTPIMLIFDEVHEAAHWQKDLKILYDRSDMVFVIATGSSALQLHNSPDLATRWYLLKIYPFSFSEFILARSWMLSPHRLIFPIRGLSATLRDALLYAQSFEAAKKALDARIKQVQKYLSTIETHFDAPLQHLVNEYISYYNIARFLPFQNKIIIIDSILELLNRIFSEDIPHSTPLQIGLYHRLLRRIAESDTVHLQTLSKEFRISEIEVEHFISTLTQAEILLTLYPHGGIRTKTGMLRKPLFLSPSIRRALFSQPYRNRIPISLKAKLYEDITAMYLRRILSEGLLNFGYGKKKNPDFVIETHNSPIIIEVGQSKRSTAQITQYGPYRYGILLNAKYQTVDYDPTHRVIHLPLSWFLLL